MPLFHPIPRARLTYVAAGDSLPKRLLINAIEIASGRKKLERLYDEVRNRNLPPAELWEAVLEKLQVHINYDADQLAAVPQAGPVVFIANHPFGVVDGLILGYLVSRVRSNFVVLVNEVLCRDDKLSQFLLPIDFRNTKAALLTNMTSRRLTLERLQAGQALAIFPAGGVATTTGLWGPAQDLDWKRFVVKVIRQTKATVVPMYIEGQNSRLFQIASQFSLHLRLSLLLHEVRNKKGRHIAVRIGRPIPYADLAGMTDRQALLDHLRAETFLLAGSSGPKNRPWRPAGRERPRRLPRYLR